jgi:hypothetical protein
MAKHLSDLPVKLAVQVVERWNAERSPLWSPTIRCAVVAGMPWLDVLPWLPHKLGDRYPHRRPAPARVGRQPCARAPMFVLPRRRAYVPLRMDGKIVVLDTGA